MREPHLSGRVMENDRRGHCKPVSFNVWKELERLRTSEGLRNGSSTATLVQHPDFRLDIVAMQQGRTMPRPASAGRVAIECLVGRIRIYARRSTYEIHAGEVLVLDCGVWHEIEAALDSGFLVTLSLPRAGVPARYGTGQRAFPPAIASADVPCDSDAAVAEQPAATM